MSIVYVIQSDGSTAAMERIKCVNEDKELQSILEKNPNLLPGEQIDPEDPRRWLLIKREMPVPDPNNGLDRWSVDFLFGDQDAVPTFVECKRFADTRSRREVVGQMFEYAANGHYYWSKDLLRTFSEEAAKSRGLTLDDALADIFAGAEPESPDAYFERLQQNLREGQVRIIFFMEESPMELRSVVDFLNKQMERSEILLVEAEQYAHAGSRIVVPRLFGYTEQARQVKRTVSVATATTRRRWDREAFLSDAKRRVGDAHANNIERFFDRCRELGFQVTFGVGKVDGSFSIKHSTFSSSKNLLNVWTNGQLSFNLHIFVGTPTLESTRDRLTDMIVAVGLPHPMTRKWPSYTIEECSEKFDQLADALATLLRESGSSIHQT